MPDGFTDRHPNQLPQGEIALAASPWDGIGIRRPQTANANRRQPVPGPGSGRLAAEVADFGEHVLHEEADINGLGDPDRVTRPGHILTLLAESGAGIVRKVPPRGNSANRGRAAPWADLGRYARLSSTGQDLRRGLAHHACTRSGHRPKVAKEAYSDGVVHHGRGGRQTRTSPCPRRTSRP